MQLSANPHPAQPTVMSHTRRADNRNTQGNVTNESAHRPNRTRTRPHTASAERSRSFVTACLDAGVPLRDVQIAARHSDPRMTTRYDRARGNLDRHANYIVVGFIEGST